MNASRLSEQIHPWEKISCCWFIYKVAKNVPHVFLGQAAKNNSSSDTRPFATDLHQHSTVVSAVNAFICAKNREFEVTSDSDSGKTKHLLSGLG